eukprot:731629-Pleurochrysis_carterae.AAC.2
MSQTAGKTDPWLRATQAEISSKSAASEKLEPFGFSSLRGRACARDVCEGVEGLSRKATSIFGALASKISARIKRRVGRGQRGECNGGSRHRSACVRWADLRG